MTKREAKTLEQLFHDTLKDIYFAEKKILSTLPKIERAAQDPALKRAFAKHKTETEGHVARLEKVFADPMPQWVHVETPQTRVGEKHVSRLDRGSCYRYRIDLAQTKQNAPTYSSY